MAKNQQREAPTTGRNAERRNGKAWSKKKLDEQGRALTGKGKPSGNSIKGMSPEKWEANRQRLLAQTKTNTEKRRKKKA